MASEDLPINRFKFECAKVNGKFVRIDLFYNGNIIMTMPCTDIATINKYIQALSRSGLEYRNNGWLWLNNIGYSSESRRFNSVVNDDETMHILYYQKLKKVMEHFNVDVSEYEIHVKATQTTVLLYRFKNLDLKINVCGTLFIKGVQPTGEKLAFTSDIKYISPVPAKGLFEPYSRQRADYSLVAIRLGEHSSISWFVCENEKIEKQVLEELKDHTIGLYKFFGMEPYTEEIIEF